MNLDYSDLAITTMTMRYEARGRLDVSKLFWYIPWKPIEINTNTRSKKIKMAHNMPEGYIMSLRYRGITRGFVRIHKTQSSGTNQYFQNGIAIDVGTGKDSNSVCLKLFSTSYHLVGVKTMKAAEIAKKTINEQVMRVDAFLRKYHSEQHHEEMKKEVTNLLKLVKGPQVPVYNSVITENGGKEIEFFIEQDEVEYELLDISQLSESQLKDKGVGMEVYQFFQPLMNDSSHYNSFSNMVASIENTKCVVSDDYKIIDKPIVCMVNHNYNLGFAVNRQLLDTLIEGKYGFHSQFENAAQSSVKIELPYTVDVSRNEKKERKKKNSVHSFIVHRTGSVTQSGPNQEYNEIAFNTFKKAISEIARDIRSNSNINSTPVVSTISSFGSLLNPESKVESPFTIVDG